MAHTKALAVAAALLAALGTAHPDAARAKPLAQECGPDKKFVIGFSQANFAEPYRQHVNDDLTRRARAIPQFELRITDGAGNVNTQVSQIENFMTQGVDLLMVSPFEAAPLTPVVTRVHRSGIPVIELDRKTLGDNRTAFVGGDNHAIAREAGAYVAKTLLPQGGEVALLVGLPSSTPAIERRDGFRDGVKANPAVRIVAEQAADWLPDKAQTAFAAMLQAHPDIRAVYASNDLMAAGAYLAARGAGKERQIAIVGTDGLPGPSGGAAAVANGQWAATFTYPTGAAEALDLARKILVECAERVPASVTVPTQAVTPENAKAMLNR